MKAVIQRVKSAEIIIDKSIKHSINRGIVLLLGVGSQDNINHVDYLYKKALELRIFNDENNKMNLSLFDIKGDIMIVPNFTLYANCKKGRRPSFELAAEQEAAHFMYASFVNRVKVETKLGEIKLGKFGSDMEISLVNDGPCTIILDTDYLID